MKLGCSKCKEQKPVSEFHKSHTLKRGYQNFCKACARIRTIEIGSKYSLAYYHRNKEKVHALRKERYWADIEKSRARVLAAAHRMPIEKRRANGKRWRDANPEIIARQAAISIFKKGGLENPPPKLVGAKTAYLLLIRKIKETQRGNQSKEHN